MNNPGVAQIIFLSVLFVVSAAMFAYSVVDFIKSFLPENKSRKGCEPNSRNNQSGSDSMVVNVR